MKRALLAVSLCVAGGAQAEIPTWAGYWAADLAWCENASRVGEVTPAPIYLADTEMLGYENSCDIISADPVPPGNAWVLNMSCFAEGESTDEDSLILLSTDRNTLSMWDGTDLVSFQRCR